MDLSRLKTAMVSTLYDAVAVVPYGEGALVSTPFAYSDGDNVMVAIYPHGAGVRVTDREEAIDRLEDGGVDLEKNRRARAERLSLLRGAQFLGHGATEFEVSHVTDLDGAARAVLDVASVAQQIEQLRHLAREVPTRLYRDVVKDSALSVARKHHWGVKAAPEIKLRNGRRRHLTARVETDRAVAYVQALSTAEAIASTFLTFSYFDVDKSTKLAVVDEREHSWRNEDLDPIADVGAVVRYREDRDLARALENLGRYRPTILA